MWNKPTNRHHIFPRHLWWTNEESNLIRMRIDVHQALHKLTDINWKATNPHQQIEIVLWILASCLTDEVKNDFNKILDIEEPEYFYKNWIYRKR